MNDSGFTDGHDVYISRVLILKAIFFLGLLADPAIADQHVLAPLEALKLIEDNQGNPGFQIIDLRTKNEFDSGHIAGARQLHFYATNFLRLVSELDRNSALLLYCQRGRQAPQAFRALERLRFVRIHVLEGGVVGWTEAGLPLEIP